jgi:high-affinity Fe2+/Pb2+ permease
MNSIDEFLIGLTLGFLVLVGILYLIYQAEKKALQEFEITTEYINEYK